MTGFYSTYNVNVAWDGTGGALSVGASTQVLANTGVHFLATSLVKHTSSGKWVACYREGATHTSFDGNIKMIYSLNSGSTWSAPATVLTNSGATYDLRDPGLVQLANGWLVMTMFERHSGLDTSAYSSISTDGGVTWSARALIATPMVLSSPAVQLSNGSLIQLTYLNGNTHAYISTNNGASWSYLSTLLTGGASTTYTEGYLMLSGSTLVAIVRNNTDNWSTKRLTSNDNGYTWGSLTDTISSSSRVQILKGASGRTYAVYRNPPTTSGDLKMVYSDDDMVSWSNSVTIQTTTAGIGTYAGIIESTAGTIHIIMNLEDVSSHSSVRFVSVVDSNAPTAYDNVTARMLSAGNLTWSKGRDSTRSLSPTTAGNGAFVLHNRDGLYSPDLVTSPLYGKLGPGKKVTVTATPTSEATRNMFVGFLDDYTINADPYNPTVSLSMQDSLSLLAEVSVSTEVVESARTGELINRILDDVGWSGSARDVDPGSTVVSWWCEHDISALEAIKKLVASEGTPAFVDMDGTGKFVFRDRNHRILDTTSKTIQATFRPTGVEPLYAQPVGYDVGWKDVINSITFSVDIRTPDPAGMKTIWEDLTRFTLASGQTKTFDIVAEEPFCNAVAPDDPYNITSINEALNDIALSGGTASTFISRTSGRSLTLTVTGITGVVTVTRVRVRAIPIIVASTVQVKTENSVSIAANKIRTFSGESPVWANPADAEAIADKVLAIRAVRNPTIAFRVNNGATERVQNTMDRQLSDRIHFIEPVLGLDDDFFIESMDHAVSEAGMFHEVTFGAERVPRPVTGVFTFDDALLGFDTGTFGAQGFTDSSTVFILDTSLLNQKLLGT